MTQFKRSRRYLLNGLLLTAAAAVLFSGGCGRKNAPRPPEDFAPGAVRFLSAEGTIEAIVLSWQPPEQENSSTQSALAGFVVRKSLYTKEDEPDFEDLAEVPLEVQTAPEAQGPQAEGESEPAAAVFTYRDAQVEPGKQYEYLVLAVNEEGTRGPAATKVRVVFLGESSYFETLPAERER